MSALFDSIFTTISEECRQADRLTHHLEGFILDYFACLREEHKIWSVPDKIQAKCDSLSIDDLVQVSWPAIASEIGISIVHFRRVFKSLYDLTPLQWRRSRILKTIAEALPLNDQQLNLYAAKFGYEDYSSFLRDFRKEYGVPPSKYRG